MVDMMVDCIGAGLAGCEVAWQLAERGIKVRLIDMKPIEFSDVHTSKDFCELVCSNSLKNNNLDNACGVLKQELRMLNSVVIKCADESSVPAGNALAVDRGAFSALVTKMVSNHENIEVVCKKVAHIDKGRFTVVAVGPLAAGAINEQIKEICGGELFFYDAVAPIVTKESIDMEWAFYASRYGKGGADYINCPLNKSEYEQFLHELLDASTFDGHASDSKFFEGCLPLEVMARRGEKTLLFGPFKPKGIEDEKTGRQPYANLQLRQDNQIASLYSLVGCQTNLRWGEQRKVFGIIPALRNAEFVRYGVMHRNTYINAPANLTANYQHKKHERIFFAGQITGVEGYVESVASGMHVSHALIRVLSGESIERGIFPQETCIGALAKYISCANPESFQPMNINFGIIPPLNVVIKNKKERYLSIANRALAIMSAIGKGV